MVEVTPLAKGSGSKISVKKVAEMRVSDVSASNGWTFFSGFLVSLNR